MVYWSAEAPEKDQGQYKYFLTGFTGFTGFFRGQGDAWCAGRWAPFDRSTSSRQAGSGQAGRCDRHRESRLWRDEAISDK